MFGNNQKVSAHQLKQLLLLNLFSGTSLILPMVVVRLCGISGVAAIGAGAILTGLFALFLMGVIRGYSGSYPDFCKSVLGNPLGNVVVGIYGMKYWVASALLLAVFAQVVNHTFLTDIPQWLLGAALLVVCTYAVSKGAETRARLGQLLVWIVIVPFVIVVLLALPKVHLDWLMTLDLSEVGAGWGGPDNFVWAVLLSFACFLPVEWLLFQKQQKMQGTVTWALVWTAVLNIAILVICVGVFSVAGMNGERWPVVTLMQVVRWPGGFLARQDGLILAFWMIGMFILISGCFHYGCQCVKAIVPSFNRPWQTIFPAVGIFLVFSLVSMEDAARWYLIFMIFAYLPLSLGIPILLQVVRRIHSKRVKKAPLCMLLLVASLLLNGCMRHMEMEDRNFVMCLGMDLSEEGLLVSMGFPDLKALTGNGENIHYDAISIEGESMDDVIHSYHAQNNKHLDFGQLQMIVFGRDILSNQKQMKQVLAYIKDHQEFTRTILVCAADEHARAIVALDDDVNGSIGIYMRQMFENNHTAYTTTIGDLILSLSDHHLRWDMAVVKEGQGVPVIVGKERISYYLETE